MSADVSLFVFSIIDGGALLFLSIYSLITLSDLECDYINVKECCLKLNRWVLPECIAYLFLIILFLFTRHWLLFLLHLPMIIYTIYFLKTNSDGSMHPYGSLIQNNVVLKKYIKASMTNRATFADYIRRLALFVGVLFVGVFACEPSADSALPN